MTSTRLLVGLLVTRSKSCSRFSASFWAPGKRMLAATVGDQQHTESLADGRQRLGWRRQHGTQLPCESAGQAKVLAVGLNQFVILTGLGGEFPVHFRSVVVTRQHDGSATRQLGTQIAREEKLKQEFSEAEALAVRQRRQAAGY